MQLKYTRFPKQAGHLLETAVFGGVEHSGVPWLEGGGGACCIKNVKALPKVIFKPAKHQIEQSLRRE